MNRNNLDKYVAICERAEKIYPELRINRISNIMDIKSADRQFNLRFDEWLESDDENFFHDFLGITCTFGSFVPRFAGGERRRREMRFKIWLHNQRIYWNIRKVFRKCRKAGVM